jgi:hypothetical protein
MRLLVGLVVGVYALYAQCANCTVSGQPILPRGFDPSSITLTVGRDTEVVIQFTLPDTVQQSGLTLYPNYAIYVDSLRMAGGNSYVVVKGTTNTPVSYGNGALRFDQAPRYKQVRSGTNAWVVVYRNPSPSEAGVPSGQPSPPRGCVRACIKGVQPTLAGTGDSLYILLRAFVPTSAIGNDASGKDTSNLMPTLGFQSLYSDVSLYYGPVYVVSQPSAIESALQGGIVLSPNPTWGVAMVRFTTTYSVPVRVRALDASGRVVHERDMGVLFPGEHTADLQLPPGIYIVELLAGKESYKARLVVLE